MTHHEFAAFDDLGALVAVLEVGGRILHWNRACSELTGYMPAEVRGRPSREFMLSLETAEPALQALAKLHSDRRPIRIDSTLLTRSGEPRRIAWSFSAATGTEGDLERFLATGIDITVEIRNHEATLVKLHDIIEQASDGIFVADLEGRYTDVNTAGCQMLGFTREEMLGRSIVDIIPPAETERLWLARERLLQGGIQVAEWTLRRRDGTQFPVEVSAKIHPDGRWQGFVRDISDRKALEDERLRSHQLLNDIVSISVEAIIAIDADLRIVLFNQGAEQTFGWARDEILGRQFDILIPERFREIHAHHVKAFASEPVKARRMGERRPDIVGLRKNGEEFPADAGISKSEVAGRMFFNIVLRDVSARKHNEDALRLSEERFRVALQSPPVIVFNHDQQLRYTWIHNYQGPLGPGQALGKMDCDLLPAAEAEQLTVIKRQVLQTGIGARSIVRATVDDETSWYDLTVEPLRDDRGSIKGVTGAAWDISERKRTEDEQRLLAEIGNALMTATLDQEQTLAALAQGVLRELADWCAIDLIQDNGNVRRMVLCADPARKAVAEAFERTPIDLGSPHPFRQVMESQRPFLMGNIEPGYFESVAQSEEHLRLLLALEAKSFIVVPLFSRGRFLGALALVSSRASRRYRPRDLILAEQISHLAALAIDNARLIDRERRATRTRDEVLGIVAHELRNPLSIIFTEAHILHLQGTLPAASYVDSTQRPANAILRAATRMKRLIKDMLDVARLESGPLAIERRSIDTRELVREAFETARTAATASSIDIHLELATQIPHVLADRDRLLQVFDNLVGNAIKFTLSGGHIFMDAAVRNGEVLFRVADTGAGIAPEHLSHLFDRFWQAAIVDRRGAGLGLSIGKGLIEAHGGRVWVESQVGVGTMFYFTLPVAPPTPSPPPGDLPAAAA